jgi:MAF protein/D-tyrosyl-tRNA(Tyr) deacylase
VELRCVIQRVSRAEVRVAGAATGQVASGLLVLAAFAADDDEATLRWMAAKLPSLRLFGDEAERLNRSLRDLGGGVLLVSQFTLYGDCRRGQRPSFTRAAAPEQARGMYERFASLLRAEGVVVAEGVFGAKMEVELVNAGPVTLVVERDAAAAKAGPVTVSPFVSWPPGPPLVLASGSPRRAELLRVAGIPFEIAPAPEAEHAHAAAAAVLRDEPARYAVAMAVAKAGAVAAGQPGRLVLGADTVVVHDGDLLEKPADADEAGRMLARLAGRVHVVVTGLAIAGGASGLWTGHESTRVEFLPLDAETIRRYVATGEPLDKAGAYGIQGYGALMVRRVEGCYFNVMGLPLALLGQALRAALGDGGHGSAGGTP